MKGFVGACLFCLAFSIIALASGVVKFKIKVQFWLKKCPEFRVAFVFKPQKGAEAAEKLPKEKQRTDSLMGLMVDDQDDRCKDV